jgi:chromosome partitioning protein
MMILCFAAHKGGVGKTTSSISLAAALARAGASTLLVDLDPQGHSSIGLGCDLEYDDPSVADILSDRPLPLASLARPTEIENLTIVPSNLRLAAAAETLHPKFKREERLAKYLAHLSSAYGWIVIDCPPALGVLTANAVMAADIIIVPCQMGARSLDGLEDLLDVVHLLKGDAFAEWAILLTMIDPRKTVTMETFQELLRPYKHHILKTRIFSSEALNQSQMAMQDIFQFDPKSRGAQSYGALARELMTRYH